MSIGELTGNVKTCYLIFFIKRNIRRKRLYLFVVEFIVSYCIFVFALEFMTRLSTVNLEVLEGNTK